MQWQFPWALWALALVPIYVLLDAWMGRRGPGILYSTLSLLPETASAGRRSAWTRRGLRALALGTLVIGLGQPRAQYTPKSTAVEGVDICIALDISRSMRAADFPPNRLAAAKETLQAFSRARENDRVALVIFAGEAFLQCPLTLDREALHDLIGAADFSLSDSEGTAIGDALVKAGARLKDSTTRSRTVVLLTDGENNRGEVDPRNAARILNAVGIRVYTIGVGGDQGVPIPIPDPVYGTTYSRDVDGSLLLIRLDEELLTDVAKATGGRYFNAGDKRALERVLHTIDELERSAIQVQLPPSSRGVAHWFYLAALLLVAVEAVLGRTWLRVLP